MILATCHTEPRGAYCLEGFEQGQKYKAEVNIWSVKKKLHYARIWANNSFYEPISMKTFHQFFNPF